MRALITGATGFVGSHLADELRARGWTLRCTVRRTSRLDWLGDGVERVEADLGDGPPPPSAFDGVDVVFHVAGVLAGPKALLDRGNAGATRHMIEGALRSGVRLRRFVQVSSLAVVGPNAGPAPHDETAPCAPFSLYGKSKWAGEAIAWAARDRLPVTVIRPPAIYGPRDKGLLPFFQAAAFGVLPMLPGDRRYSIVHVRDLARGIADAALAESTAGQVYFLCNDDAPTFARLVGRMLEASGVRARRTLRIVPWLLCEAAAASELLGLPGMITRDKVREFLQPYWTCTAAKARRDFGFVPAVDLARGFRETFAWYRDRRWI